MMAKVHKTLSNPNIPKTFIKLQFHSQLAGWQVNSFMVFLLSFNC